MIKVLIFGAGYVGRAFIKQYNSSIQIISTKSSPQKGHLLFNEAHSLSPQHFRGITHALITIPPVHGQDIVLNTHKHDLKNIPWIGYLSTTSVYGDHNGAIVAETSNCSPTSNQSQIRYDIEKSWHFAFQQSHIFRLSGIYGPGRNLVDHLRKNKRHKCILAPNTLFSRIHICDIVSILHHFIMHPQPGLYNLADDCPAPTSDVCSHAATLLGLPLPPFVPLNYAHLSPKMARFYKDRKIVSAQKVAQRIPMPLVYPSYKKGLLSCL